MYDAPMKQLWAPWRMDYILAPKPDECVFCLPPDTAEDEERLILHRGRYCFAVMNKYPYNNGHTLICPNRHVMNLEDLSPGESSEMMNLLQVSARILKEYFHCDGLNIGLNQGKAAGAGIGEHLHFHLVPRWVGDSSFIAVMDDVRTMPQFLSETWKGLVPLFQRELPEETSACAQCRDE